MPDGAMKVGFSALASGGFGATARRVRRPIQSLAAHQLLGSMLRREHLHSSSLRLNYGPDGNPLLLCDGAPSSIAVALSHSNSIAACAITDLGAIGIDVEFRAHRQFQRIAATAFGPMEQSIVEREGSSAFYRIWTLREALAKATLRGITMLNDGNDYFADAPQMGIWSSIIDDRPWMFSSAVLPDNYAIAVALAPLSPVHSKAMNAMTVQCYRGRLE
jgi:4'-phosphopantetheinyl transferase